MLILMLLILIALVALFMKGRHRPAGRTAMILLSLAAILLAGLQMRRTLRGPATTYDPAWEEAVGHALGREVADALPDGGTVAVLQFNLGSRIDLSGARLRGLEEALPDSRYRIVPVTIEFPEGDGGTSLLLLETGITWEMLGQALKQAPGADALVSFTGIPYESRAGAASGLDLPPVFATQVASFSGVDAFQRYPDLMAYVNVRDDADFRQQVPRRASLEELFDRRYVMVRR